MEEGLLQWRRKMAKPGGANLLIKKYFYGKKLWSTLEIRWGCSPIAPPFPPPMSCMLVRCQNLDRNFIFAFH